MKKDLHPELFDVKLSCVCGNSFETTSTVKSIEIDICSACHPYFTGNQKFVDRAGRIERFKERYTPKSKPEAKKAKPAVASKAKVATEKPKAKK